MYINKTKENNNQNGKNLKKSRIKKFKKKNEFKEWVLSITSSFWIAYISVYNPVLTSKLNLI